MYDIRPKFRIRGLFRYLVLYLLRDEPLHGYEIMQRIKELLGADYEPSPGIVYPTLQLLEDMEYVTSERIGRRTVYHITEKGKEALKRHEEDIELMIEKMMSFRDFLSAVGPDFFAVLRELAVSYSNLPEDKRERVRETFRRFVREIRSLLGGD